MHTGNQNQLSTPLALDQAMRLTTSLLPKSSHSFERISAETALEVVSLLRSCNHTQDEQLTALLWLFPDKEIPRLAPGYLVPAIRALPNLWKQILTELNRRNNESIIPVAIQRMPPIACSIASAYLYVLNEHGRRQIFEFPDQFAEPLPIKQFLANFLCLAKELTKKDPYMTADRLLLSVCTSIEHAALTDDLMPETTWVWAIRSNAETEGFDSAGSLKSLKRFLREFWLTTGSYPPDHASADKVFFVRIEKDRTGAEGAIDRLMTSLSIRFSMLFDIRKEPFSADMKTLNWSRVPIHSWHQGLGYSGRHQCLLKSKAADPLSEFIRFKRNASQTEEYQQLIGITRH